MAEDIKMAGDVVIAGGDFEVADSTRQHQEMLLVSQSGEWKQHPKRGVGVQNYVEDCDSGGLARKILSEYSEDGMRVRRINIDIPKIEIDAEYEESE